MPQAASSLQLIDRELADSTSIHTIPASSRVPLPMNRDFAKRRRMVRPDAFRKGVANVAHARHAINTAPVSQFADSQSEAPTRRPTGQAQISGFRIRRAQKYATMFRIAAIDSISWPGTSVNSLDVLSGSKPK